MAKELGFDPAKVNPNGGAIALGHPIAATACLLTIQAIAELQRTGGRYALVTMCIGGGHGIASVFERVKRRQTLSLVSLWRLWSKACILNRESTARRLCAGTTLEQYRSGKSFHNGEFRH